MNLTIMQKRYIWLAGSFPARTIEQGQGKRTRKLLYALDGEDNLVIFGYSNPMQWLVHRGLFRPLQARNMFTLTNAGEDAFERLNASGGISNDLFEEVKLNKRQHEID